MAKKEQELEELRLKQIATVTGKGEAGLYGLAEDGKVYVFHVKKRLWLSLPMMTPKREAPQIRVEAVTYGGQEKS